MKKKVLLTATVQSHICQFHKPLVEVLHNQGYEVHVAAKNNLAEKNGLKLDFVDRVFDVPFSRSPWKFSNFLAYKSIKNILAENKYDFVHCNTPMGGVITRLAAKKYRKKGTKVFYTAHGFHFFKGAAIINWLLYYPIEWICSWFTDCLITINQEDFKRAQKRMHAKRIEYIHGVGTDFSRVNTDIDIKKKKDTLGILDNEKIICSIGELSHRKNHIVILKALKNMKENVHYCIAGNGPLGEELEKYCKDNGIENRVHFFGYTRNIGEIFALSDIFVFPSLQEGLPVALMEAMAAGLPIVCSNIRGNVDLINDGQGGFLCDYNDVEAFKEKIDVLINNQELRGKMSDINKDNVEFFGVENVKKELINIYK